MIKLLYIINNKILICIKYNNFLINLLDKIRVYVLNLMALIQWIFIIMYNKAFMLAKFHYSFNLIIKLIIIVVIFYISFIIQIKIVILLITIKLI